MLPKKHRLTRPADFARVYARSKSSSVRLLVLYRAPNELEHCRFGISVSRRVGSAVVRNRCKRRIREALRPLCAQCRPGHDVVLVVRRGMVIAQQPAVAQALRQLLQMADLLCE